MGEADENRTLQRPDAVGKLGEKIVEIAAADVRQHFTFIFQFFVGRRPGKKGRPWFPGDQRDGAVGIDRCDQRVRQLAARRFAPREIERDEVEMNVPLPLQCAHLTQIGQSAAIHRIENAGIKDPGPTRRAQLPGIRRRGFPGHEPGCQHDQQQERQAQPAHEGIHVVMPEIPPARPGTLCPLVQPCQPR